MNRMTDKVKWHYPEDEHISRHATIDKSPTIEHNENPQDQTPPDILVESALNTHTTLWWGHCLQNELAAGNIEAILFVRHIYERDFKNK